MDFETAYKNLNAEQKAAVDYIEGPLLVIAGPGTGKTQLLSVRVANILKQTDASPDNILCLTFTDAAANNMRHRLAGFIGPDAYKVNIHTYHSFGSYLLQEHRPDLQESIDQLDRFAMIRDIQAKLKITSPLRADRYTNTIISAISDLKSAAISADDLEKIVAKNEIDNSAIIEKISDLLTETSNNRYPKNIPYYQQILETLETFVKDSPEYITDRVEPIAHIYYRSLAQILLEWDGETSIAKALGDWRKKYFEKDADDKYRLKDYAKNALMRDLIFIMREYSAALSEKGLYDYDDMILLAIDLLKNDDEKRFNAQERFQYILLDEYQDTNDAQAQLVALLTDNPSNEGRPNIMAVGDDDQAIYGFQGASSSNFFDYDKKYHPEHILLNKNYRSSAEILELAHNVIEQGEDRFCKAPNVNIDKVITAENAPDSTTIEYREFKSYQAEYSHVATQIRSLLDSGVTGNKIAIIAPKHKHLISILPYLHSLDILVSYEKRENVLDNPKIATTLDFCELILKLANNPFESDEYCFHIFSLDCWQINISEMLSIINAAKNNQHSIIEEMLTGEHSEQAKTAAEFCMELASKINTQPAEYFITVAANKLYPSTDDYDYFSNLSTIRESILAKNPQQKLSDFYARIEAYRSAEIMILDHSPYHEASDAVTIQTVHSSKGLEYDYVFLIAADNDNWANAKGNNDRAAFPFNLEYVHHTGDSSDEKLRLFFVAITRARAKLLMSYSISDFTGRTRDRLKFLDIAEDGDNLISRVIPEHFATVIPSEIDEITPRDISPDFWFDKYIPTDETKRNLYRPKVEHFRISPTHVNSFVDLEYGGPTNFFRNYIIGIRGESSFAIDYGNFIHDVMDEMNKNNLSNEEVLAKFKQKVSEATASEEEKRDLLDRGESELSVFLSDFGDKLRSTKAESERSFFGDNITIDDVIIGGKIDRIEIDEDAKTITVADYKTSKLVFGWKDTDFNSLKLKIQLYFYKFLIENSNAFPNYKVTTGRIDFIRPNLKTNHAWSLSLDFDDAEAEHFKKLIVAVCHRIKALDFSEPDEDATSIDFIEQLIAEA